MLSESSDSAILLAIVLFIGFIFHVVINAREVKNSGSESQHQKVVTEQVVEPVDEIAIKQSEMRDTIVFVQTRHNSGSGTIIDRIETDDKNRYKYFVLTNAHVTRSRFIPRVFGVDSFTGKTKTKTLDTGCGIITFNHKEQDWKNYTAKVVSENIERDLALLSFISEEELSVAKVSTSDMLEQVRVFDEVFAVGCQLGRSPTPTFGIISQILGDKNTKEGWLIYGTTAQITPGSSGGGLFREYSGHYYLIGIPYKIAITDNGQMVSHITRAISIITALDFIDKNAVSTP